LKGRNERHGDSFEKLLKIKHSESKEELKNNAEVKSTVFGDIAPVVWRQLQVSDEHIASIFRIEV
jgi:hypothetical protein